MTENKSDRKIKVLQNKSEEREGVEGLVVWADGHALAGALDCHMAYWVAYDDGHARGRAETLRGKFRWSCSKFRRECLRVGNEACARWS